MSLMAHEHLGSVLTLKDSHLAVGCWQVAYHQLWAFSSPLYSGHLGSIWDPHKDIFFLPGLCMFDLVSAPFWWYEFAFAMAHCWPWGLYLELIRMEQCFCRWYIFFPPSEGLWVREWEGESPLDESCPNPLTWAPDRLRFWEGWRNHTWPPHVCM